MKENKSTVLDNNYDQNFDFFKQFLQKEFRGVLYHSGSIFLGKESTLSGQGKILFSFFFKEMNKHNYVEFLPKEMIGIGSELSSFEFSTIFPESYLVISEVDFPNKITFHEGLILEEINFYGEEKNYQIRDEKIINEWNKERPEEINIEARTIDIIHFKFSYDRHFYLYSEREGEYRMYINSPIAHVDWFELQSSSYAAMGKKMKLMKSIK